MDFMLFLETHLFNCICKCVTKMTCYCFTTNCIFAPKGLYHHGTLPLVFLPHPLILKFMVKNID